MSTSSTVWIQIVRGDWHNIQHQARLSAEVIEGIAPVALQEALQGRTIKQAHRKGKHMWLEFDQGPCLMLHFGKPQAVAAA